MSKTVDDLCMFLESGVTVAREYDFSHSTSSHEEFQEVMKNLTREREKITVRFRASSSVASIVVHVSSYRLFKC